MGVEADLHLGRRDPARELDQGARIVELDRGLLVQLADCRGPVGPVALALARVDRAAGKHPHAAHEACVWRAPDEQHLEALGATAQQDHGGGLPRRGLRTGVVLLAGGQTLAVPARAHTLTLPAGSLLRMSAIETLQRWICESCGFIYDPDEGDPDGGIPPGTAFEDIPDTWFCPVCGARKRDFVPYED